MADSIYTFAPVAGDNSSLDTIPYGPNQLYHNKIDDLFRAYAAKLAQYVDDLGAVNTVSGTDTIAVTLASGITAYAQGQHFRFIAANTNTGAATMNVNAIGAKAIRKISGGSDVALVAGDIVAGETYLVRYDTAANSAAGAWIIVGAAAVAAATTSAAGIVELATLAETLAGTDTSRAVVPANLYQSSGHISADFRLSTNSGDATNDIDITAHTARDSTDSYNIVQSALTKQLDVAWAVGTNQGMLATGASVTNTTYYLFDIKRPDTGVVDFAADTSSTGANIAANTNAAYTIIRRVGYVVRTGGVNAAPIMYVQPTLETGGGAAPFGAVRAAMNFNGTGTAAIRWALNLTLTDNGTGDYTGTFVTAMPDANYVLSFGVEFDAVAGSRPGVIVGLLNGTAPTSSAFRFLTLYEATNALNAAVVDRTYVMVKVVR
jgi:hypothetical protein